MTLCILVGQQSLSHNFACHQGVEKMRAASQLAAKVLQYAGTLVKVKQSRQSGSQVLKAIRAPFSSPPAFDLTAFCVFGELPVLT